MLVIYPNAGYNSFVDLPQADTIAATLLGSDKYLALSEDDRKRYLIAAFNYIQALDGIEFPVAPEECINSAQVKIAVSEVNSPTFTSFGTQEIKSAKVGPVSVTYTEDTTVGGISSDVKHCLEGYNAVFASIGFNTVDLARA